MEHATFQSGKINRFQQSVTFNRSNTPKVDLKTLSFQESILHRHWNSTTETWELCLGFTWWVGVRVQRYSRESGVSASRSPLRAFLLCWWTELIMSRRLQSSFPCDGVYFFALRHSIWDVLAISESNSVRY